MSCTHGTPLASGEYVHRTGNDQADDHPRRGNVLKRPSIPQRRECPEDEDEVADQIGIYEPHNFSLSLIREKGKGKRENFPFSLLPCPFYRRMRTTMAARRLSRRVSSRLLSYLGRSSP